MCDSQAYLNRRCHDLQFQGQMFGFLLFCCNFITVERKTKKFCIDVHVNKGTYEVQFQPDC